MINIMAFMQSYKRQKIDQIRCIYGKNDLANAITETSSNLVFVRIISTNKVTIWLEKHVK